MSDPTEPAPLWLGPALLLLIVVGAVVAVASLFFVIG